MLMTAQKTQNKLQEYAARAGIYNESQLRTRLKEYGVGSATSQLIWKHGVTKERKYDLIEALEEILKAPSRLFIEDKK